MKQQLKRRRCILVARGTDDQVPRQIAKMRSYATTHGMIVVDVTRLESMSAMARWTPDEVNHLIDRKSRVDDFDVLLLSDLSRISRCFDQSMYIVMQLLRVGIRVIALDTRSM